MKISFLHQLGVTDEQSQTVPLRVIYIMEGNQIAVAVTTFINLRYSANPNLYFKGELRHYRLQLQQNKKD